MDFEETIRAIETLDGEPVQIFVYGSDGEVVTLVMLAGPLRKAPAFDPAELEGSIPADTLIALREANHSVTFNVGDSAQLWFSADRFIRGEVTRSGIEVEVVTSDGAVRISRSRRWID